VKKQSKNPLDSDAIKNMEPDTMILFRFSVATSRTIMFMVKVYLPYAETVRFSHNGAELNRLPGTDFFEYKPTMPNCQTLSTVLDR